MTNVLVIRGGTVIDGTGSPGVQADVAVADGRIAEIGSGLTGDHTLDASGCVVAPGFIDIHTHYDAQVFWDPALTPSCFHGVTTVVAGNCGFSIAPTRPEHHDTIARTLENVEDMNVATLAAGIPWDFVTFPEYLASVERHGIATNFAVQIGHTATRLFVMGDDAYERAATPHEIEEMQAVVRDGLLAGAAGFATSFAVTHRGVDGKPIPSRFAERAELEALLETVGEVGRGVVSTALGEPFDLDALYELQPRVGVPFTYTALLTSPTGSHREAVEHHRRGWQRGAQVWPQVSPRPLVLAATMAAPFTLNVNPEFGALMSTGLDERRQAYSDPQWRAGVR
ncbi:MAG TPA: amidohydrolase family protein, partial [Acidimicrobiia bacterium]